MHKSLLFIGYLLIGLHLHAGAQEKTVELKTVTIKGNKNPLKETAKGAILDISKIPDAYLLTLSELLSHIPGVEVSSTGRLSYMGRQLSVLRDGVDVAGFNQQIMTTLQSGASGTGFTKIELNLYNLKTESPTISFVAPKYDNGYYGSVMSNAGSNSTMGMGNISLFGDKYSLNFNGTSMLQYGPGSENYIETDYYNTQTHENRKLRADGAHINSFSGALSGSYFICPKHTLNASVSKSLTGTSYQTVNEIQQYQAGILRNNSITTFDTRNPLTQNPKLTAKLSYVYKIKTTENVNQRFDVALDYEETETRNKNTAATQSMLTNFIPNSNYNSLNSTDQNYMFGMLAYEYDHNKLGDFEIVARYFNRKNYESYDYTYETDAIGNLENLFQDNHIAYHYGAVLASWSKRLKGLSVRAVIKQDYSSDNIGNLKGREHFNFSTFAPYLSLQRTLNKGSLRFEASYSRLRPQLSQLSTVVNYGAQYNISNRITLGNAFLKPSGTLFLSTVYNTNIKVVNLVFTGNYNHTYDAISPYETTDADNIRMLTYRNLASRDGYTANVSFNFYLFPRFTVQMFTNNSFQKYKVDNKETQNTYRWSEGLNLGYTISPRFRLGANAGINGGTNFQTRMKAQFSSGLTGSYAIRKLNFNWSVSNFHQSYFNVNTWTYGYGYESHTTNRSRRIMGSLSLSYAFGKASKKANVPGKEIRKDDM